MEEAAGSEGGVSWHWRGGQLSKFSWRLPEAHKKVPLPADTLKAPVKSGALG